MHDVTPAWAAMASSFLCVCDARRWRPELVPDSVRVRARWSAHHELQAGERYTSLETKVNFVRAITSETGRVRCEAAVVHRGGKIATAEGMLVEEETGKLLAHGTTTCLLMSR